MTASHKAEVAVLGAGPAGSVAARQLGQAGLDVLLIDPGPVQGGHVIESLPPSGAPLAEDIGLLEALCDISEGPAAQMQMLWRETPETRVFEGDGPLLLRRAALHVSLQAKAWQVARRLCGRVRGITATRNRAEIQTDVGLVSCQMVIDARGRQAAKRPASDLVALGFSAQAPLPDHSMWLEAMPTGWIWACSLDSGKLHGALFQPAAHLAGLGAPARLAYAQRCLAGSGAFANVHAITLGAPRAAGLSAVEDPVLAERHLLAGDAALARDPIASHGLVHALRSGVQAAVAARTILDPSGDTQAALAFVRHKHAQAVASAQRATAQAYRDQQRYFGTFWTQRAAGQDTAPLPYLPSGPVTLTTPLTRAPVLERDRIRWAPAIELPASRDFFTGFGSVTALEIAAACRPSAPLQEIATRLGRSHAMPVVFDILQHLTLGGAFAQPAATA